MPSIHPSHPLLSPSQQQQCIYTESRKMVLMSLFAGKRWRCRHREWTCGYTGEGKGGMNWESSNDIYTLSKVQSLSRVRLFMTTWTTARKASLSITNSWSSPKFMSTELVMPSNHLILCRPLLFPPSIFPSIRVFSNMLTLCIRWPKYWLFSFSICPSDGYSGLISFRIGWFDLLAVHGTLKSLLQHHSSKTSIVQPSGFFMV